MKIKNWFRIFSCAIVVLPLVVTIMFGWFYYREQVISTQTKYIEEQVTDCQLAVQEGLSFFKAQLAFLENTYLLAQQIETLEDKDPEEYFKLRQANYNVIKQALNSIDGHTSLTTMNFENFFLPEHFIYLRNPSSTIEEVIVFDMNGRILNTEKTGIPGYTRAIPNNILSLVHLSQDTVIRYIPASKTVKEDHDRVLFAENIKSANGNHIVGGVGIFVDAERVREVLTRKSLDIKGKLTLFSSKGEYIFNPSKHIFTSLYQLPKNNEYRSYVENILMQANPTIPEKGITFKNQENLEVMLSFRPILNTDWLMTHTVATNEIATNIKSLLWHLIGLAIFMILMTVTFGHVFIKLVFAPLERITEKLKRIRNGEKTLRLYYQHNNEIKALVTNFNAVIDEFNELQKRTEAAIGQKQIIMDKSDIVLFEIELDSMIITFDNSAFIKTMGIAQVIHVDAFTKFMQYSEEDKEKLNTALKHLHDTGTPQHIEIRIQPESTPEPSWWTVDFMPISDNQSVVHKASGVTINITAIKQEQIRFQTMAEFDTLCNIYNRSTLFDKMDKSLEAASEKGEKLAFIFIDIDDFKQFNSKYGHEFGDRVIKFIGRVIRSEVTDEIGYAGRYGGDEFIICINDQEIINKEKLTEISEIIRNRLLVGIKTREKTSNLPILCSMGISIYPDNGFLVETLLDRADKAMYHVKETGKNGIFFAK